MIEVHHMLATAIGPSGEEDETATVILSDDGVLIDSVLCGSTGMTWESLAKLIDHPYAEEKLLEVDLANIS